MIRVSVPIYTLSVALLMGIIWDADGQSQNSSMPHDVVVSGDVVSFPPVRRSTIDLVLDSIQSKSPLLLPPLKQDQNVHPNIAGIWAGTKTEVDTRSKEVKLKFRPTAEARLARAKSGKQPLLEEFEITVTSRQSGISLQHSQGQSQDAQRGVQIKLRSEKYEPSRIDFIPGVRDSGAYIAIPSLKASLANDMWGAYICPRRHVLQANSSAFGMALELLRSPYELAEVKLGYSGEVSSQIPAEFREERLKVHLAVSEHLPTPNSNKDEVKGLSPTLYVRYQPREQFSFFHFRPRQSIQEGLLTTVEMENPAGYVRRQYFSDVTYVQRIDDPSPVPITIRGLVPYRDEGVCYLVLMQKSVWSEYDIPREAVEEASTR